MSWLRIEGSARDPELSDGLAARIADPLWTLARQWQTGEFHGEDAASPIIVTADVAFTPITAFAPGGPTGRGETLDRTDADRPLEVLVEQEAAKDDFRLTLELGWILVRSLLQAGLPDTSVQLLRNDYAVTLPNDDSLDPNGRKQLELIARRSIDGVRLAARLAAEPDSLTELLKQFGAAPDRLQQLNRLLTDWLLTVEDFIRLPDTRSCWRSGPLEYQFRVAAPLGKRELALDASEYRGGTLDWYHFRRSKEAEPLGAAGEPLTRHIAVLPTPLRFHGMPAPRFWAIEDEAVSFGDLAAGPEDLVRAIVGGFAAVYGDDWLIVPCQLPAGSIARVTRLTVHDDYGKRHTIPAVAVRDGPDRVWRFFEIEDDDGPDAPIGKDRQAPLLMLAPALPDTEEGPPLERVDFARDQVSNLAWAIERRAMAASGRPVDRDTAKVVLESSAGDEWSYQAYAPVPQNWIPLVPVQLGKDYSSQVHLRRGRMAVPPPGVPEEQLLPMGRLLEASRPLRIREEAVADAGLRIDRRYQRARGADGKVHLWIGRRVRTGAWPAAGRFTPDRLIRQKPTED